jgi:UDP-arabinose 4-epimerase
MSPALRRRFAHPRSIEMAMDEGGSILVTGGAGYLGSHVCKALARAGWRPVAYDNLSTGQLKLVKWGPLEHGDIADRGRLAEVFLRVRPRAVIHLAALCVDAGPNFDPDNYYETNVAGSVTLLRAMAEARVTTLVYCSAAAVYGVPDSVPVAEDQPLDAITPYGTSKLMVERTIPDFANAHRMSWITLRVFNAIGADPDGEAGECHRPETHLVPSAIEAAMGKRESLRVYGTDYGTEDGTAVRDFVHVSDVAQAHVLALRRVLDGTHEAAVNIGSGVGHSVSQVIDAVERATGRAVPVREAPPRPGDAPVLVADCRKAASLLGWRPRKDDLCAAVATAFRWHAQRVPE